MKKHALCVRGEEGLDESLLDSFADDLTPLLKVLGEGNDQAAQKMAAKIIDKYTHGESSDDYVAGNLPRDKLYWLNWQEMFAYTGGVLVIPHDAQFTDRHFQTAFCRVLEALAAFERANRETPAAGKCGKKLAVAGNEYLRWLTRKPVASKKLVKPKKSTAKGDAAEKIKAALLKHHKYADDSCLNQKSIGVRDLARMAEVSPGSVTAFFNRQFKVKETEGRTKYMHLCRDNARLIYFLKMLSKDFVPGVLMATPDRIGGRASDHDSGDDDE